MEHNAGWYRQGDLVKIDDVIYRIRYSNYNGKVITWTLRNWMTGVETVCTYDYFDKVEKG